MKKIERSELKKLKGGLFYGGGSAGGDGGHCKVGGTCGKWVGGAAGHWESGTCSMGVAVGGLPAVCECSNGGTGCVTEP